MQVDDTAFGELVAAESGRLARLGTLLTGDPARGRALAEEALARALLDWRHVREDEPVAALRRALFGVYGEWWRLRYRRYRPAAPEPAGAEPPDTTEPAGAQETDAPLGDDAAAASRASEYDHGPGAANRYRDPAGRASGYGDPAGGSAAGAASGYGDTAGAASGYGDSATASAAGTAG